MSFLILWILTILSSYGIAFYTSASTIKNIYDNGYKLSKKNMNELSDNLTTPKQVFKLSMLIPFYNLFNVFKILTIFNLQKNQQIFKLKVLGLIEEMNDFEKQEYAKNPGIIGAINCDLRLERATKVSIKEELGESIAYIELKPTGDYDILYTTGPISRLNEKEQREKIDLHNKIGILNLLNVITENSSNQDILDKDDKSSNDEKSENKLDTINAQKEALTNLKQELIARKINKETIEEPKIKSMK